MSQSNQQLLALTSLIFFYRSACSKAGWINFLITKALDRYTFSYKLQVTSYKLQVTSYKLQALPQLLSGLLVKWI